MNLNIWKTLLILFGASFSMIAQEINGFDAEGKRHGVWRKNYDGTKVIRYEGEFNHGREVGFFKFYENQNGQPVLAVEKKFFNDSNDAFVQFFEDGKRLISEGRMSGKYYVGEWKYYQKGSKALLTIENYNDNGLLDGKRITYYVNGQIAEEKVYVDGKLEGESKWYSENGMVLKAFNYKGGELHGLSKYYDATGNLLIEGAYKNGKKDGIWKHYENGKLSKQEDLSYQPDYIKVDGKYKKAPK